MDYSIASRVISAIQVFRMGNDEYPLTDDQQDKLIELENQMMWRNSLNNDKEKVFQLFSNHTLDIEWILPPVEALLDEKKYTNVNDDILLGMGFPRSLIVGENEKSNTGNIKVSSISPEKTIERMRNKILTILKNTLEDIFTSNSFKGETELFFDPINLVEFSEFVTGLKELYDSGNLSRTEYSKYFGYNWMDQIDQKEDENSELKERNLEEFAPKPFSPAPNTPGNQMQKDQNIQETTEE
jgi:hypothetical protein